MTARIFCGGVEALIIKGASVTRKASDLITTATVELPYNNLGAVQNLGEVAIEYDGKVLFHGVASDPSLTYSGGGPSMSIQCVDLSYKLARMVLSATDITTYTAATDVGAIVYALLADTGIDRSKINQTTGITIADDLEIPPGEFRLKILQDLMTAYKMLFWLSYAKVSGVFTTYGEFDTYANLLTSSEWVESHSITETNIITFNLGLKQNSDMICTRVICIWENAGEYNIGAATATGASSPYLDKVVKLNADEADAETDLDAVAADYLTYYQNSVQKVDMSFKSLAVGLFNQVNISGLSDIYGSNLDLTTFRVTDITQNITPQGIISSVQGVDPDADLWEFAIRGSSGRHEIDTLIWAEASKQAEDAKPVYATVIEPPT